jgi:hypothetical protein
MLRFFSNIRYKLAAENRAAKYLRYSVGEILLVVIGILIALQVNNWNENRKNAKIEANYLASIRSEIKIDTATVNAYLINKYEINIERLKLGRSFYRGSYTVKDTLNFIGEIAQAGGGGSFIWTRNTNTYQEMESTGNLRLIRNEELRAKITRYYSRLNLVQQISDNGNPNYRKFINSIQFYDLDTRTGITDKFEQNYFLSKLKQDSFYELCNSELAHAQTMNNWAETMFEESSELIHAVDLYLKSKE